MVWFASYVVCYHAQRDRWLSLYMTVDWDWEWSWYGKWSGERVITAFSAKADLAGLDRCYQRILLQALYWRYKRRQGRPRTNWRRLAQAETRLRRSSSSSWRRQCVAHCIQLEIETQAQCVLRFQDNDICVWRRTVNVVFGISVKEGARWVGCGERAWARLQKKNNFCPKNKFGWILTQFLTDRKHGQSREALGQILRFSRETMLTTTVQKLSKNSRSDQRRGGYRTVASPPPEYAADSMHTQLITRRRLLPAAGDVLQRCTLWFCGSVRLQVKTRCSSSGGGSASQTAGAATPSAKVRSCRTDKHVLPPEICPTRNVGDREADVFELGWTMDI